MKALAFFLLTLSFGGAVAAEPQMSDPMRPPEAQNASVGPTGGPVLQSVMIGKDRRYAIISGERVFPGSAYGEAKVVHIMENQVTLRDASGDTVLKLYPQVDKSMIVTTNKVSTDAVRGEKGKK